MNTRTIRIYMYALVCALIFTSCHSDKKYSFGDENEVAEEEELPYGATDTINGVKVSRECALMNYNVEALQSRVEDVKSPDMLMHIRARLQHDLDSLTAEENSLPDNEKAIIEADRKELQAALSKACRGYEVPADGVIANLKYCIKEVQEAKSKADLKYFMEGRYGMLSSLDDIHLCVENGSRQIGEVRRLAQQLKQTLKAKEEKFGMKDI